GLVQNAKSQETDEYNSANQTKTLEDYLKESNPDSNDTLFSSPTVGSKTEATTTPSTLRPLTDPATVEAPKRLPSPTKGLERSTTEPNLESLSTEPKSGSTENSKKVLETPP